MLYQIIFLPVVLYGCEIRSLSHTAREHRMNVREQGAEGRISAPKKRT
jgi:hypothetical protein